MCLWTDCSLSRGDLDGLLQGVKRSASLQTFIVAGLLFGCVFVHISTLTDLLLFVKIPSFVMSRPLLTFSEPTQHSLNSKITVCTLCLFGSFKSLFTFGIVEIRMSTVTSTNISTKRASCKQLFGKVDVGMFVVLCHYSSFFIHKSVLNRGLFWYSSTASVQFE